MLLPSLRAKDSMRAWASRYARAVFERCERNKRRACRALGISCHTLNAHLRFQPGVDEEGEIEEGEPPDRTAT